MRDLYSNIAATLALAPAVQSAAAQGPAVDLIRGVETAEGIDAQTAAMQILLQQVEQLVALNGDEAQARGNAVQALGDQIAGVADGIAAEAEARGNAIQTLADGLADIAQDISDEVARRADKPDQQNRDCREDRRRGDHQPAGQPVATGLRGAGSGLCRVSGAPEGAQGCCRGGSVADRTDPGGG